MTLQGRAYFFGAMIQPSKCRFMSTARCCSGLPRGPARANPNCYRPTMPIARKFSRPPRRLMRVDPEIFLVSCREISDDEGSVAMRFQVWASIQRNLAAHDCAVRMLRRGD